MILFDATHTSHTSAQTGIQRVCRSLFEQLHSQNQVSPVCYDPHLIGWRSLNADELGVLRDTSGGAGKSRGAKWTLSQKVSGAAKRWLNLKKPLPVSSGFICPELFSAKVGSRLPEILSQIQGPRVALFYDGIPLKFPELTPSGTVARFPCYLKELLQFDGIAAISEDSAASLRDYWHWLGVDDAPPVHAIPLGIDFDPLTNDTLADDRATPRILCVCTIEGRKNHLALLEACENLWNEGFKFELQLIGMARPDTAATALAKINSLQGIGCPIIFNGSVSAAELARSYIQCSFTVYPSLIEGFGMPVLESLQYGKPCICSGSGALGESAHGGGCMPLSSVTRQSLANGIRFLLKNPGELEKLRAEARHRKLRSWGDYARDFTTWMKSVPRKP